MFEIHETIEVGVNENSNKDRKIFKPYKHKINSRQLKNQINSVIRWRWEHEFHNEWNIYSNYE
jgi:hypothetical protein